LTTIYLAWSPRGTSTLATHADCEPVDLLVAFPELRAFNKARSQFNIRTWCMDSGAFGAWNSGKEIDLNEYMAACLDSDADEVFGLDVIGDPEETRVNLERMWERGIAAIPTFHWRSDWSWLTWCCDNSEKVALGGLAGKAGKGKPEWVGQCFARAWPKRIHGFAMAGWPAIRATPFHSVDASSWAFAPSKYSSWCGLSGRQIKLFGVHCEDLWMEVEEHQRRARWAAHRWRRELEVLR